MISTSTAARRRTALLAQQRPSSADNRQQQQEGSTDFQWVPDACRAAFPAIGTPASRGEPAQQPTHRILARAPVIGALSDLAPSASRRDAESAAQLG